MEYIKNLLKTLEDLDLYPDICTVEEIRYPTLIINNKEYLCLCSNNYLGLSIHPEVKASAIKAIKKYGIGTCESRLISGNLRILEELESAIAEFKHEHSAIVFITGFMTNISIIPAIMDNLCLPNCPNINDEDNLIIGDILNHTSISDGCKLSKATKKSYKHRDMNHLEGILKRTKAKRKLIVTDGIFSMDGDLAPLPDIIYLAGKYNAMVMIDDAHATGVMGKNGRGTSEYFGVEGKIDFVMGTLSKAIGATGGYLTGAPELIKLIRVKANPYIFSSSLPAEQAAGIITALKIIKKHPELRAKLWKNVQHLKKGLKKLGYNIISEETHIIPVLIGDEKKCVRLSRLLFDNGILTPAIRWPAVSPHRSRIRCTVTALHTTKQIDYTLEIFEKIGKQEGLI